MPDVSPPAAPYPLPSGADPRRVFESWRAAYDEWIADRMRLIDASGIRKVFDLAANMDVIVKANRQIVEIQFFNSSLIGLSLVLTKG